MTNQPEPPARRASDLPWTKGLATPPNPTSGDPQFLQTLSALLTGALPEIQKQWFFRTRVSLDGYRFVRCRFDQCIIDTRTGNFEIDGCAFSNCDFFYAGQAERIVKLFNITATEAYHKWPWLAPTVNADGTLT